MIRSIFLLFIIFAIFACLGQNFLFRRVLGCLPCTHMYENCTYYNMTVLRIAIEYPCPNFEHDGNKKKVVVIAKTTHVQWNRDSEIV